MFYLVIHKYMLTIQTNFVIFKSTSYIYIYIYKHNLSSIFILLIIPSIFIYCDRMEVILCEVNSTYLLYLLCFFICLLRNCSNFWGIWLWRYGHEVTHLWRRIICHPNMEKKGEEGGRRCTKASRRMYGCSLWRNIKIGQNTFFHHVDFEVDDGNQVRFQYDKQYGNLPQGLSI